MGPVRRHRPVWCRCPGVFCCRSTGLTPSARQRLVIWAYHRQAPLRRLMISQRLWLQIEFAVRRLIRDSSQPSRQTLLRELLNSRPDACRSRQAVSMWDRCCRSEVAALPWDHFGNALRPGRRPPTVLDLLRR
jgi:hypothetical protein